MGEGDESGFQKRFKLSIKQFEKDAETKPNKGTSLLDRVRDKPASRSESGASTFHKAVEDAGRDSSGRSS